MRTTQILKISFANMSPIIPHAANLLRRPSRRAASGNTASTPRASASMATVPGNYLCSMRCSPSISVSLFSTCSLLAPFPPTLWSCFLLYRCSESRHRSSVAMATNRYLSLVRSRPFPLAHFTFSQSDPYVLFDNIDRLISARLCSVFDDRWFGKIIIRKLSSRDIRSIGVSPILSQFPTILSSSHYVELPAHGPSEVTYLPYLSSSHWFELPIDHTPPFQPL